MLEITPSNNPLEKMTEVSAADKLDYVKSKIGEYADFPKKGIVFRWVSELIRFYVSSQCTFIDVHIYKH